MSISQSQLAKPFYQSFDASQISSLMDRLGAMSEAERHRHPDYIGEGLHFQTFLLPTKPMRLVLKIAKSSFFEQGPMGIRRWRRAIQHLKEVDVNALIPPMEVLDYNGLIGLVMPKGEHLTQHATFLKPIQDSLLETAHALREAGLVLDDYPQLLQCDGVAFIRDWSDLQITG